MRSHDRELPSQWLSYRGFPNASYDTSISIEQPKTDEQLPGLSERHDVGVPLHVFAAGAGAAFVALGAPASLPEAAPWTEPVPGSGSSGPPVQATSANTATNPTKIEVTLNMPAPSAASSRRLRTLLEVCELCAGNVKRP